MGGSASYRNANRTLNFVSGNQKLDKKVADATNKVLETAKRFETLRNPNKKPDVSVYKSLMGNYGKDNSEYNSALNQITATNRSWKSMSPKEQKAWNSVADAINDWSYYRNNQLYSPLTYGAEVPRDALRG